MVTSCREKRGVVRLGGMWRQATDSQTGFLSLDITKLFHGQFVDLACIVGHAVQVENLAAGLAQVLSLGVLQRLLVGTLGFFRVH